MVHNTRPHHDCHASYAQIAIPALSALASLFRAARSGFLHLTQYNATVPSRFMLHYSALHFRTTSPEEGFRIRKRWSISLSPKDVFCSNKLQTRESHFVAEIKFIPPALVGQSRQGYKVSTHQHPPTILLWPFNAPNGQYLVSFGVLVG